MISIATIYFIENGKNMVDRMIVDLIMGMYKASGLCH